MPIKHPERIRESFEKRQIPVRPPHTSSPPHMMYVFFMLVSNIVSVVLVIDSTKEVVGVVNHIFALQAIVFVLALLSITTLLIRIKISKLGSTRMPDASFMFNRILLGVLGFFQTVLWVIDHDNSIHEPRAVLILGLSGAITILLNESRKKDQEQSQVIETSI